MGSSWLLLLGCTAPAKPCPTNRSQQPRPCTPSLWSCSRHGVGQKEVGVGKGHVGVRWAVQRSIASPPPSPTSLHPSRSPQKLPRRAQIVGVGGAAAAAQLPQLSHSFHHLLPLCCRPRQPPLRALHAGQKPRHRRLPLLHRGVADATCCLLAATEEIKQGVGLGLDRRPPASWVLAWPAKAATEAAVLARWRRWQVAARRQALHHRRRPYGIEFRQASSPAHRVCRPLGGAQGPRFCGAAARSMALCGFRVQELVRDTGVHVSDAGASAGALTLLPSSPPRRRRARLSFSFYFTGASAILATQSAQRVQGLYHGLHGCMLVGQPPRPPLGAPPPPAGCHA